MNNARFSSIAMTVLVLLTSAVHASRHYKPKTPPKPIHTESAPPIAYYPGADLEIELALSKADLLPYAVAAAGTLLKPNPEDKAEISNSIEDALKGVSNVWMLQMSIAGKVDPQQIIGFYSRKPESKQMTRVFRSVGRDGQTLLIWSGKYGNGLFVLRLAKTDEEKSKLRIQVARLDGKIDIDRLLRMKQVTDLIGKSLLK